MKTAVRALGRIDDETAEESEDFLGALVRAHCVGIADGGGSSAACSLGGGRGARRVELRSGALELRLEIYDSALRRFERRLHRNIRAGLRLGAEQRLEWRVGRGRRLGPRC